MNDNLRLNINLGSTCSTPVSFIFFILGLWWHYFDIELVDIGTNINNKENVEERKEKEMRKERAGGEEKATGLEVK
jgi:hypothetical protein